MEKLLDVLVENINWNVASVLNSDSTENSFLSRHMSDELTYDKLDSDKKTASLKLVWKLCVENSVNPLPETKPKAETETETEEK